MAYIAHDLQTFCSFLMGKVYLFVGQSQGRSGSPGYADSITPDSESPYSNNFTLQSTSSSNASTGEYDNIMSWSAKFVGP